MKHKILIPANAEYSNIEFEFEGTAEQAIDEYYRLFELFRGGKGLDNKTFIGILDELWEKESISGDPGIVEQMSESQRNIIRAFKLVIQRAKDKNK